MKEMIRDTGLALEVNVNVQLVVTVSKISGIEYRHVTCQKDRSIAGRLRLITGSYFSKFMRAVRLNVNARHGIMIVRAIRTMHDVLPFARALLIP